MSKEVFRCLTVSDFNTSNFSAYLVNDRDTPSLEVVNAPYGQVAQALLELNQMDSQELPDAVIAWTRPDYVCRSFSRMLKGESERIESVISEVDDFASLLTKVQERVSWVLVPSWVLPPNRRHFSLVSMKDGIGIDNTLMRMNLRLAEGLEKSLGCYLLNAQSWISVAGERAFNDKLWFMSKVPFGNTVFKEAVVSVKSALRGLLGQSKKLIILDLDETLWGGIVGEVGWNDLRLGGHDPVGEAFVEFQWTLKSLVSRGVLLGIVSKNEESVALEAIRNHPEMVLRIEDFAGWRINWQDKAQNIADLVTALNLGLDAVVFIDDSAFERARVAEALPQVTVPDWPDDRLIYASTLRSLPYFDFPAISEEDRSRTSMYVADRKRTDSLSKFSTLESWLGSLGTKVRCELLGGTNLPRATQLLNKTNQMNLSTRRMSEQDFMAWASESSRRSWVFRVEDRFGDLGLVGILSLEFDTARVKIIDFVLSCRAMGRSIEETMLATAIRFAQSAGVDEVIAQLIPTERNGPCLEFLRRSKVFSDSDGLTFRWRSADPYPVPEQIQLIEQESPHTSSHR